MSKYTTTELRGDGQPTTAFAGDDALKLRRQSDNPRDPGYNVFLSEPIVVLADLRASRHYEMTPAEADAEDSFGEPLCARCDLEEEGVYAVGSDPSTGTPYRELLSGHFLEVRVPDAAKATMLELYDPWHLEAASTRVASVPWDISPSITQEPFHGGSYGHGEIAPGTVLHSGEFTHGAVDLVVPSVGFHLTATRAYRNQSLGSGSFGPGWDLAERRRLRILPNDDVQYFDGTGRRGTFKPARSEHRYQASEGLFYQLLRDSTGYQMLDRAGNLYEFDHFGRLTAVHDKFKVDPDSGTRLEYRYDLSSRLISLSAHGRSIFFDYGGEESSDPEHMGRIAKVRDELPGLNREVSYHYDDKGRLQQVKSPEIELSVGATPVKPKHEYGYETSSGASDLAKAVNRLENLSELKSPHRTDPSVTETWLSLTWENVGDGYGSRVAGQTWGAHPLSLDYTTQGSGPSAKVTTTVTDRRGKDSVYQHNATGQVTSYKDPANHETIVEYGAYGDNEHGLVTLLTLPSGRSVAYVYDKAEGDPDGAGSPPFTLPNVSKVTHSPGDGDTSTASGACETEPATNGTDAELVSTYQSFHPLTQEPRYVQQPNGMEIFLEGPGNWIEKSTVKGKTGPDLTVPQEAKVDLSFDDFGRLEEKLSTRSDQQTSRTVYHYPQQANDRAAMASAPERVEIVGGGVTFETSTESNALDLPTRITEPGGTEKTFEYNALGWLLKQCVESDAAPQPVCSEQTYDPLGRVIEAATPIRDGNQHTRSTTTYGLLGEVLSSSTEKEPGGDVITETRTYDENLNLAQLPQLAIPGLMFSMT